MILTNAEIWDGNRRLAEELRGGGDTGELLLGPINKGKMTLNSGKSYTVSEGNGTHVWECVFLSDDGGSDNARFRITAQKN
jgi:hypothetical protein